MLPFAAVLTAVLVWGLSFLSIKITVAVFPPMTLALLRFIMASVLLFGVLKLREPETKLDFKDLPLFIPAGVIGITLYFFFENNGVKIITASAASIIIATIPILTLVADALILKNRLTGKKIISVFLSMIGVCLVVGVDIRWSDSGLGYLMMLGAAISWVIYTIITKPLFKKYSQLAIVFYQTVIGTIALIPFALLEKTDWNQVSITIVLNLFFLGVCCSALGYYVYAYALDKLGANLSALFLNFIPVVAVVASCFILKERLSFLQILGGVIVISAVTIVNWQKKQTI